MKSIVTLAAALMLTLPGAFATRIATNTVTGTLNFGGNLTNFFDPSNSTVPPGYANSFSDTATLGPGNNIFYYSDAANTDMADFNGNTLTVTDDDVTGNAANWTMTFTDPGFTGITLGSDNFINGGVQSSILGDVITLTWSGDPIVDPLYTATFDITNTFTPVSAPDGALTLALLGLSLTLLGGMRRSRAFAR